MIELHNHLPYGVLSLWNVPKKYGDRDQWSGSSTPDYHRLISGPMGVLGRDESVVQNLFKAAVLTVFKERCSMDQFRDLLLAFEEGTVVHAGDDVPSSEYVDVLGSLPDLRPAVLELAGSETPAAVASAVEFVMEGLHLSKRLNKDSVGGKATYRSRG